MSRSPRSPALSRHLTARFTAQRMVGSMHFSYSSRVTVTAWLAPLARELTFTV